jgi:hypothetical protein
MEESASIPLTISVEDVTEECSPSKLTAETSDETVTIEERLTFSRSTSFNDVDGNAASLDKNRIRTPAKSGNRGNWTEEEDEKLRKAVAEYSGKNWKKIAEQIPERSDVQCLHRWQKVLRPGLVKGPWTPEVNKILFQ